MGDGADSCEGRRATTTGPPGRIHLGQPVASRATIAAAGQSQRGDLQVAVTARPRARAGIPSRSSSRRDVDDRSRHTLRGGKPGLPVVVGVRRRLRIGSTTSAAPVFKPTGVRRWPTRRRSAFLRSAPPFHIARRLHDRVDSHSRNIPTTVSDAGGATVNNFEGRRRCRVHFFFFSRVSTHHYTLHSFFLRFEPCAGGRGKKKNRSRRAGSAQLGRNHRLDRDRKASRAAPLPARSALTSQHPSLPPLPTSISTPPQPPPSCLPLPAQREAPREGGRQRLPNFLPLSPLARRPRLTLILFLPFSSLVSLREQLAPDLLVLRGWQRGLDGVH